jgi:hypothetical protein
MVVIPIVIFPLIIEPNSIVEARAYPNERSLIVVISVIFFYFNTDTDLGQFLRRRG